MSLFGTSKPAFGTTTTPGFSFGSTATTSAPAPLFGSTATSTAKPLFGTTTTTAGSLFGAATTSAPLFGSTTTTAPLFGATTTSAPSFGGFSFSSQPAGSLFGAKPTTTTTPFSFSTTAAKPGGLFGTSTTTTQAAQPIPVPTLQDVIQNSESLVRSLTAPELFGDERDALMARLNQLLAACGVGVGYFKADQQPITYNIDGPFFRFKAIGYNRRSEYRDSDGVVSLILGVAYEQLSNAGQRQKLIDALNVILGNNVSVRAHIETVRPLPGENSTEVLIYVTERGKGRVSSKDLCAYLKQPTQEGQLKSQLCATNVVARSSMDDAKLRAYLKNVPPGFDAQIWRQAIKDNPDPERLIPYPIRGFEQLRKRQQLQIAEIRLEERVLDELKRRLVAVGNEIASGQSRYSVSRQREKELSHRLLRCVAMQTLVQRYSVAIDGGEEKLESQLEALNAALVAPNQLKSRITDLITILRDHAEALKARQNVKVTLKEADILQIKKFLSRRQEALEALVSVVNSMKNDIKIMESHRD